MPIDKFWQSFQPDIPPPVRLVELLAFQEAARGWYSGSFELSGWEYRGDWFGENSEAAKQFVVFGRGPDGSMYAFWLYPGRTLETAPVVFLGSDASDCGVLAASLDDFLALLAFGADELGRQVPSGEIAPSDKLEPCAEPIARHREFQAWLLQKYGIQVPAEPMELVRRARSAHPTSIFGFASGKKDIMEAGVNLRSGLLGAGYGYGFSIGLALAKRARRCRKIAEPRRSSGRMPRYCTAAPLIGMTLGG